MTRSRSSDPLPPSEREIMYKVGNKFVIKSGEDKDKEAIITTFRPAQWAYGIGDSPGRNGDTIAYTVNGETRIAVSVDYFETVLIKDGALDAAPENADVAPENADVALENADAAPDSVFPPEVSPSQTPPKRKRIQRKLYDGSKIKGSYDRA